MVNHLSWTTTTTKRIAFLAATFAILAAPVFGAPTILSVSPVNGATGVSTSSQVVFTFSEAMYTGSSVLFSNVATQSYLPASGQWSAGNTVLTWTPAPSWPSGAQIGWYALCFNASFVQLTGTVSGSFSTGSGGGGSGSGTNSYTQLSVGQGVAYDQSSTNAPTLDPTIPYSFVGSVTLISNLSASGVTLTLPTSATTNLTDNPAKHEEWYFAYGTNNQTAFYNLFPSGTNVFTVTSGGSNRQVSVVLPTTMSQPGAPRVANYPAAQAVDATQPFTLSWDAFPGGTSADYVGVTIGSWSTASLGVTNALPGTATSVVIPANTLQGGTNYSAGITFYRYVAATNSLFSLPAGTIAYKAAFTQFNLATLGTGQPVITNVVKSPANLAFDVQFSAGQQVTVISSTNLTLLSASWPILLSTNAAGTSFHVVDKRASNAPMMFYRARNGP